MTVLVLGSSGLIGRRLVSHLAAAGTPVVACDAVPPVPNAGPSPDGVVQVTADVTRLDQMLDVMARHDVTEVALLSYVMGPLMSPTHSDILGACEVNIVGVTNVLEAARLSGVRRLVFMGTVGTYGPQALYGDRAVDEDDVQAPTSLYGRMKLLNESICERYVSLYGLDVVRVRPSAVLGPGSTIWPARFIEPVARGQAGQVQWGIDMRDNVVAVDDLVWLLAAILAAETVVHRIYLAAPHNITMRHLADVVSGLVPDAEFDFPTPDRRPSYAELFNSSRAVNELGWLPSSLTESVRDYIDAVRAERGPE